MEQDECRASLCPLSCPYPEAAQCWQQQGKQRTELHLVHEAPKSYSAFSGLIKTAFPRSARIQTGNCGANTLAFAMGDKRSLQLLSQLWFLLFHGVPCRLQLPAPSHTAFTSWDKITPICRAFPTLWESRLCSLLALVCVSIQTPRGHAHLRLLLGIKLPTEDSLLNLSCPETSQVSLLERAWQPSPGEWCCPPEPGPGLCWNTALQRMMHPWFIPVLEQPCWGHASPRMLKGATLGAMSLEFLTQFWHRGHHVQPLFLPQVKIRLISSLTCTDNRA